MADRKNNKNQNAPADYLKLVETSAPLAELPPINPSSEDTMGGRIRNAREVRGLTVAQLAQRTGVLSKTLQNWETDRSEPRANKLQLLAGVLSVPPLWLLSGEGAPLDLAEPVNMDETASLQSKVDRLLELHQQSSKLMFEIQSEVLRLQNQMDTAPDPNFEYPKDTGSN